MYSMSEFYPTSVEDVEEHIDYGNGLKKKYSYTDIHGLVSEGVKEIIGSEFKPDYIVAIGGGGLIPARMLRTYLDVPILVITVQTYEGDSHTPSSVPKIIQTIDADILKGKTILIVDEVDDTRITLGTVLDELIYKRRVKDNRVKEWGVFVVHNKKKSKAFELDPRALYVACEDTDGSTWIEYPWDSKL